MTNYHQFWGVVTGRTLYAILKGLTGIAKTGTMTATYTGGISTTQTVPYVDFLDGMRIVWQPAAGLKLARAFVLYGSLYASKPIYVDLEKSFTSGFAFNVSSRVGTGASWTTATVVNGSEAIFWAIDIASRAVNSTAVTSWIAVGRWK